MTSETSSHCSKKKKVLRNEPGTEKFENDNHPRTAYIHPMNKAEILAELPLLTKEERFEIRVKLAEMDGDGWLDADDPLTGAEKALLEARLEDMEKHPDNTVDLRSRGIDEVQAANLRARLKTFADDWGRPEASIYDEDTAR